MISVCYLSLFDNLRCVDAIPTSAYRIERSKCYIEHNQQCLAGRRVDDGMLTLCTET